jgi:hypothetical protein
MSVIIDYDHESGDLSEYGFTVTDSGDLSVQVAAALAGTGYGMQLVIDDTTAIYGQRTGIANSSGTVRARFYIDPNGLAMANGNEFKLLLLYNNASAVSGRVGLVWSNVTGFNIRAGYADNAGTYTSLGDYAITDEPHYIEIRLVKATADGANDGTFSLWIDGVLKETDTGIDNDVRAATFGGLDFGAPANLDVGTSGTFFLDELVINDDGSEIGPVGGSPPAGNPWYAYAQQ